MNISGNETLDTAFDWLTYEEIQEVFESRKSNSLNIFWFAVSLAQAIAMKQIANSIKIYSNPELLEEKCHKIKRT